MTPDQLEGLERLANNAADTTTRALALEATHAALKGVVKDEERKAAAEHRVTEIFERERIVFTVSAIVAVAGSVLVAAFFASGRLSVTQAGGALVALASQLGVSRVISGRGKAEAT